MTHPTRDAAPRIANPDMAAAWDGPEGDHWTEQAAHYERTTQPHRNRLLEVVPVRRGDRVLDIGCGTGALTRAAARRSVDGHSLGVDLSRRMLERARSLTQSEGITNATYEQADAEVHPFAPESADLVVSSFGAMFFGDPVRAFANVVRTLAPGGRVGLLSWQGVDHNPWITTIRGSLAAGRTLPVPPAGAPGPFGLADPDQVRTLISGVGLADVALTEIREPVCFGADADEATAFVTGMGFARGLLGDLDASARAAALATLHHSLTTAASADGVLLDSAAWIITARA